MARAGIYVDGFNLYHAIHALGEPWLKWLDIWKLGQKIAQNDGATLTRAFFCTAVPEHTNYDSKSRHQTYNAALRAIGVKVIPGHHVWNDDLKKYSEKQSDINVALTLICDAADDKIDTAILVSADSDQAATAKVFRERYAKKRLILAAPPKKPVPQKAIPFTDHHFVISQMLIDESALPEIIQGKTAPITRPPAYQPPGWWMHPDNRPA